MTIRTLVLACAAVLASPLTTGALAQTPATPPGSTTAPPVSLTLPVKEDQELWITSTTGSEVRGKVLTVTPTSIDVRTDDGITHINVSDVLKLERQDSNWSGFAWGVGVGALAWAATGGKQIVSGTQGNIRIERIGAGQIIGMLLTCGGVGALIDSVVEGRDTIYRKPESTSTFAVLPVATLKSVGIGASLTWK